MKLKLHDAIAGCVAPYKRLGSPEHFFLWIQGDIDVVICYSRAQGLRKDGLLSHCGGPQADRRTKKESRYDLIHKRIEVVVSD